MTRWEHEAQEEWPVVKLRYALEGIFGGLSVTQVDESDRTVPVTRIETISQGRVDWNKVGHIDQAHADRSRLLRQGDIIFSNINSLSNIGNAAQYFEQRELYLGMNCLGLRPAASVHPQWVFWWIKSDTFRQRVEASAKPAINQASISQQAVGDLTITLPSIEEQRRIAAFLDHETARIDELVREQEQLVNHLVEKKFSLTWNAVTGGDRSDRVSTSVEWLPTIPRNWKLANLGYLVACLDGKRIPLNAEERATMPGVVPYWGANGVVDYVAKPLFDERLVLIGEDGAPFFDRTKPVAFVVNEPIWPNNHIHVLRPRDRSAEEAEWLASVLNVTDYVGFVEGATRDKLTQGRLLKIPIPVPPSEERDRLLAGLRPSLIEADTLLKEAQHMVDVLLERRSSLISAAVTGHLDLQDWRPHEAEAVAEVA